MVTWSAIPRGQRPRLQQNRRETVRRRSTITHPRNISAPDRRKSSRGLQSDSHSLRDAAAPREPGFEIEGREGGRFFVSPSALRCIPNPGLTRSRGGAEPTRGQNVNRKSSKAPGLAIHDSRLDPIPDPGLPIHDSRLDPIPDPAASPPGCQDRTMSDSFKTTGAASARVSG
jgi:hypothetical protein